MEKRPALLSAIGFAFVLLAILGISLTAQAAPTAVAPQAPTAPIRTIINEFYRDSNLGAGNEWVEILLVEDLTAAQLQGFYMGDSTTSTVAKFSGYRITNTASIAAIFPKGTLIVIGGSAAFSEDLSYAPGSGDWNILLNTSGAHVSSNGSTGDLAATDVVYVDSDGTNGATTISTDGFAVNWDSTPGTLGANSTVTVSVPANGTGVVLTSTLAGATTATSWATSVVSTTLTPGQPNGGNNTTYINSLRAGASSTADLSLLKSGPATANAGDAITYTISLSNTGTATATLSVLTDTLPAEISFVTYTTASAVTFTQASAAQLVWELGDVLTTTPEISIQVVGVITTNITNGTVVTNTAVAASASPESSVVNNVSQFATTVSSTVLPDVEVYVQKTTPAAVMFGGELISYTIVYGNDGTQTVNATLTDTLPISFTTSDIALDTSGLNPIDDTNTRSWTATLASGDRFTFTLALTVPTSIVNGTRITNTIEITAADSGNNPLNDLASASGNVYQIVPISAARAGTNGQVFAVEGQVIYAPSTFGTNEWGVQDASGGISVFYSPAPVAALGDRVRLVATRGAFNNQEQLAAPVPYFANLGSGPQVQPLPYTTGQVASGSTEGWLVVVTGTVSSVPATCTGNYQFNIDDGSGSTAVFVDQDTTVNVCTLGVVNGDPLVVTGFSTQFGSLFEIKPRFPADVKRLYQVNFVYNDLEDAVQVGEDVQLRGDFTNWGTNPITLAHDANYTVFSATVTLPTTATQLYKYYVTNLSGNAGWDMLNTNNRSVSPVGGVTLQNEYRNISIGWGNLNGPAAQTINLGSSTTSIDGQLYVQEVTNPAGAGRGLKAEVGYGNTANLVSWSWFAMAFASQTGNNDVYAGVITPTAGGVYSYATRYNGNWGVGNPNSLWVYADLDGIPFSLDKSGVLTVTAPQLAIYKAVATASAEVQLGEVVTYTFTLSNTGDGTANSILITDVLPTAVNFGGFVQQNGATFGSGAITWNGSLNAGAAATVVFTATVKNDQTLYGTDVMNIVQFTSGNGGSGSANIAFAVVKRYFLYLPLIQR